MILGTGAAAAAEKAKGKKKEGGGGAKDENRGYGFVAFAKHEDALKVPNSEIEKKPCNLQNTIFVFNSAGPPRAEQQPLCVRQGLQAHRGVLGGEQEGPQRQVIFFESAFPFFSYFYGKTSVGKLLIGFSLISDSLFIFRQKRLQKSRENNPNFKGKGSGHQTQGGGEGVQQKQVCPISHTNRIILFKSILSPFFERSPSAASLRSLRCLPRRRRTLWALSTTQRTGRCLRTLGRR